MFGTKNFTMQNIRILCTKYSKNNRAICVSKRFTSNTTKSSELKLKRNIDYKDVEHHTSLQNIWWDAKGPMKALHSMNELRVPFIRDGIASTGKISTEYKDTSKPLTKLQLLEVGCGGGILTEPLARLGAQITGLDAGPELIALAKNHLSTQLNILSNVTYVNDTIEEFAEKNIERFDAVIISEVLEHIDNKETFLKACVKSMKIEGSIFITTFNKNFVSWLCGIILAEHVLNLIPRNTHQWEKFICPHETQRLLEINNCSTHRVHGLFYQFWNNQWIWCSNTDITYGLHAVKYDRKTEKVSYHDK